MHFIPLEAIVVPEGRIRRSFSPESLGELKEAIRSQGLFHAILLRADGMTLIAGERRLRAIKELYDEGVTSIIYDGASVMEGHIPAVKLYDEDAASVLEAELTENTRRQQLTWQEQALATSALHELRKVQNPEQTTSQTTQEIFHKASGGGRTVVTSDLLVAQYLDDADVAKSPSKKEALRLIERKLMQGHREALAKAFGPSAVEGFGECHLGSMETILPTFAAGYFDCIIADPPYGIGADTFANQSAIEHSYADDADLSDNLYNFIAREGFIRTKEQAHAYLFCDPRRFEGIRRIFSSKGWRVWPWPLIWYRGNTVGLLPWPEHGPRRTYEAILFAIKGDRRVTGVFPDVLNVPHDRTTERGAHKPPELYAELIKRSCFPGDKVVDPCCGAGAIFTGSRLANTYAVGIELEPAAYTQALGRLRGKPDEY